MLFYSGEKVRIVKSSYDHIPEIAAMIGNTYGIDKVTSVGFLIGRWMFTPDEIQLVEEE